MHTGNSTEALRKSAPVAASASRFGVRISGCPMQPSAKAWSWSARMNSRFFRSDMGAIIAGRNPQVLFAFRVVPAPMESMREPKVLVDEVRDSVERLYRADGQRLWRAIVGFAASEEVADEAVAEAFAQLLRRGADVRDPDAWVWRTAFAIARGELKRLGEIRPVTDDPGALDAEPPWDLIEALGVLSPQQRAVLILRDYVGHSSRATAEILDSTEPSVRVQLSRARRKARKELSREI